MIRGELLEKSSRAKMCALAAIVGTPGHYLSSTSRCRGRKVKCEHTRDEGDEGKGGCCLVVCWTRRGKPAWVLVLSSVLWSRWQCIEASQMALDHLAKRAKTGEDRGFGLGYRRTRRIDPKAKHKESSFASSQPGSRRFDSALAVRPR